ncbi:MAG: hypothetical protein WBM57_03880 [Woeseiaceae bacterium]
MNQFARIAAFTIVVAVLLTSAFADAKARKPKELLQYIPADTPYVMAVTKPLPDDLMDKIEPSMDKILSAYQRMMRYRLSEHLIELSAQEDGAEKAERLQSFMDEMMSLMSIKGLRDAGIGRDSLMAVYGDGMLPVFRIGVTDVDKFEAAIARLESRADEKFMLGELAGETYRYRNFDELSLVIATIGKDAVITMVPAEVDDERLAQTLGIRKPRNSIAHSKDLAKIARQYGFTDHFVSFIDVERIAAVFTGDPTGRNAALLELLGVNAVDLPPECQAEIGEMASVAPRIVLGYTAVDRKFIETAMVVELRDDIASGMATLPSVVPGLGSDLGGLFSFGFSLDLLAARAFYEARLDALDADPFECARFADLNAMTVEGREALAKPVPPVVYSFRGMLANVTSIEGLDLGTDTPPESIDASILLAIENAQDLVTMAAMMSPEVAALNLLPDGKAKALNLPQLAAVAEQAFAALTQDGLAVALGDGAAEQAEAMLSADASASRPFASFSMDAAKYYEFVGEAIMKGEDDGEGEPMPEAMRKAMKDVMISSGEMYERMTFNVHLTERGVEINSRLTLADQARHRREEP